MKMFFRVFLVLTLVVFAFAGCATTKNTGTAIKEGSEAAGKEVQDTSITSAIKMKYANDDLVSPANIDVKTEQGHVTLTGTVASQAALDRAVQLARSVEAVKSVHSNLTITPK